MFIPQYRVEPHSSSLKVIHSPLRNINVPSEQGFLNYKNSDKKRGSRRRRIRGREGGWLKCYHLFWDYYHPVFECPYSPDIAISPTPFGVRLTTNRELLGWDWLLGQGACRPIYFSVRVFPATNELGVKPQQCAVTLGNGGCLLLVDAGHGHNARVAFITRR